MQLSRKPVPSLVSPQHSTTEQVRTLIFFEATDGLLFGLLLRILGHTQTAKEVLAEVYEEVSRRAALFNKQNERPLTWLILIAHRRAIERLCSQLTANSETFSINITEQRRLVRATLAAIPPLQHRMIELAFFSGMSSLEIAKELGQSPAAVEGEIRYAMLRLFRLFKSMGFTVESRTHT